MKERKRILMVHNYYQLPGGEDTVVANEKKMLEERGHKVILYTRNNNEIQGMNIFRKLLLPFAAIYNPRTARDIKRIIKDENIDIVHVHNTLSLISASVYYAALNMNKPVVQTVHNFRLLCPGATFYRDGHICEECVQNGLGCAVKYNCYRGSKIQTLVCVIATMVHRMTGVYGKINYICLTEFNRNKLLGLRQVRPNRVFVKPNFVEPPASACIKTEDFIFVGRLEEIKGIMDLLKAWERMGEQAPVLNICGTGPLLRQCRAYIRKNTLKNVNLLGFVDHEVVKDLIGKSKYLILPTRVYEGFPLTVVEAFSAGTAVIVPDMGNTGDLVKDGINGFKFKSFSIESLTDCIYKAISKKVDLKDAAYEEYSTKYTAAINIKMLEKIYRIVEKA